jgi:hypothetical protein
MPNYNKGELMQLAIPLLDGVLLNVKAMKRQNPFLVAHNSPCLF